MHVTISRVQLTSTSGQIEHQPAKVNYPVAEEIMLGMWAAWAESLDAPKTWAFVCFFSTAVCSQKRSVFVVFTTKRNLFSSFVVFMTFQEASLYSSRNNKALFHVRIQSHHHHHRVQAFTPAVIQTQLHKKCEMLKWEIERKDVHANMKPNHK